jgi:hypothetical protein
MDVPPVPAVPISMDNIQMESPADMNRLPQQVLLNIPPRRRGTSGYVDLSISVNHDLDNI